jgi:geranylgeranyl diphosphate synthase type II
MFDAFEEKLNFFRKRVDTRIAEFIEKPHPITLYEPMRYTLEAGGKRIRPLLVLLATEAVGGDYHEALDAAVAVELLHTFTLIHDDVMDHDDTRRGRPTVHKKWDVSVAILSGDGLVALSYEALLRSRPSKASQLGRLFSNALLEICEGQALDKEFETRPSVAVEEYFEMIRKKTAALLALCGELGAILGGGGEAEVQAIRQFGIHLGMAFQIQDDLLDIAADEKKLGKTWGSDVLQKKKTLLLIHALKNASEEDRSALIAILNKDPVTLEDVYRVKEIYERAGTLARAEELVQEHLRKARESLQAVSTIVQDDLIAFLDLILHRKH